MNITYDLKKYTSMKKIIFILSLVCLIQCSPKVAYHNGVKEKYKLEESEIKKIQFYTSDDIILYKTESESDRKTNKGELVVSNKTAEDRIIIKKGTRGVVLKIENANRLQVSFETDDKTLNFESVSEVGQYKLKVDEVVDGKGKVKYGANTYYVSQGNGTVYLKFKIKKLNKSKSKDQVVGGRKVD